MSLLANTIITAVNKVFSDYTNAISEEYDIDQKDLVKVWKSVCTDIDINVEVVQKKQIKSKKLESDTKNIGEYTCFKATMTREVEDIESGFTIKTEKHSDEKEAKEKKMKTITITAWYTPQIPVSVGPAGYHGLPGLILEANDGSQTIICSKIVINPKKSNEIIEPTKGKKVTQKEFDAILEKKMKEMEERFRPHGRGDGESIEIRIGG